jgi:Glycosyltransferase
MKKILFILHLPPPIHGSSMIGELIKDSSLINDSFDCRYINLLMSRTINETGRPSILKVIRFIKVWFKLLFDILKDKPDVCYLALTATGIPFYKDVLLVALLRLFKIKRIYHLHNKGVKNFQTSKINFRLYRFVFNNADVILLSKQLYKDIETFVPSSRVHICPNGIEDTVRDTEIQFKPKENPAKILFLSNLLESKGVFVLLDACAILKQKGIDFECNLIGAEGDLSAKQFNKRVVQKGVTDRVVYLGKKFGQDKYDIFMNADIFAFPTYYFNECFPLVLLEAMSFGLPLVSTFEGGIPDIIEVGTTGYLVPQRNVEALADKLEILIKNPELRQQMGKAGRIKYQNEFTLPIFENRLKDILERISN